MEEDALFPFGTSSFAICPGSDLVFTFSPVAEEETEKWKQKKEELEMGRALLNYYSEITMIRRALERIASRS